MASKRNRKTPAWMESYVSGEQLSSGSVTSDSTTKKLLKAELEAQRRMAEMEEAPRQERLATERALVEKTLELKKAEIREQSQRASSAGSADIDDLLGTAEVEQETVDKNIGEHNEPAGVEETVDKNIEKQNEPAGVEETVDKKMEKQNELAGDVVDVSPPARPQKCACENLMRQMSQMEAEARSIQRAYEVRLNRALNEKEAVEKKLERRLFEERELLLRRVAELEETLNRALDEEQAIEKKFEPPRHASPPSELAQLTDAITAAVQLASSNKSPESKLEKCVARQSASKDLPLFSGAPAEWPAFHVQFQSSTSECQYSYPENLARLQKSLWGKAKEAVQALLTVPDNVPDVMKTLEMRFGRPELVIRTLIAQTRQLKAVKDDLDSLMEFASMVNNMVSTMKLLNSTGHLNNPDLRQEMVERLPSHLRLAWGEHVSSVSESSLQVFADWLSGKATAASLVATPTIALEEQRRSGRTERVHSATEITRPDRQQQKKCGFCKRPGHAVDKCTRFRTAPLYARWNWACAEHVCFRCLLRGHSANECKAKKSCGEDGCESSHHRLLHRKKQSRPEEPAAHAETEASFSGHGSNTTSVLLRILPVTVSGPSGHVETFALLDEGSTATLLDAKIAHQIGATGETAPLVMRWTDCTERQYPSSQRVTVCVSGSDGPEFPLSARTVDHLDLPTQSVSRKLLHSWCHLRDSRVAVVEGAKPTVLIGTDNAHLSVAREVVEGPPNAPMLTKTRLGWVVQGKADRLGRDVNFTLHGWCRDGDEELHQLVKSSFSTDAFGVSVRRDTPLSKHERRAEEIMLATTRRADGTRWQTGLLWKEDDCQLPPSKAAALSRLHSLERKMDRLPDFADQYSAKIKEYVTSGFARPLSEEEAAFESPSTWYLPHFAVWNPNKPGKLRLVFDAAAKAHGSSLNDHLLPGPDLLNPLVSVLYKFRQRRVAFGGDIRSMFHMVTIQEEDQSA